MFQKKNPCNRRVFELAVAMLKFKFPMVQFEVKETYMDYGAGIEWETIVCSYREKMTEDRFYDGGYQMLSPVQWQRLDSALTIDHVAEFVTALANEQAHLLGKAGMTLCERFAD